MHAKVAEQSEIVDHFHLEWICGKLLSISFIITDLQTHSMHGYRYTDFSNGMGLAH